MKINNLPSIQCRECSSGLCQTNLINLGVTLNGKQILRDINLHIHCGELTAIVGANGAGKTTLIKAILGEIPHSGRIEFADSENHRQGNNLFRPRKQIIGYVPQKLDFDLSSPTTVLDLFTAALSKRPAWFGASGTFQKRARKTLELVQASALLERRLGALSGGELQRVLLALALDPIPHLLLLDEPVSGIDQNGLELFYQILSRLRKEYDLSIILVSHDLDMIAQYANRVVLLHEQTVECTGTPEEVLGKFNASRKEEYWS